MKFVDIKNDVAFRKIFGNENKTEVLVSFLNAVLCLEGNQEITEVTILTPYQLPELRGGKVTIVDVKAKDQLGKTFIVEMQIAEVDGFHKRVLYYASKSYSAQINRGDDYENLMPTLFIGILDFEATQSKNFISRHIIQNADTGEHFIRDIEFNFIELPKFNKSESELSSVIDQWIYFIKNAENLDIIPQNIADIGLKVAYQEADKHNWTREELEAYDKIFMREQDDRGRMNLAIRRAVSEAVSLAVSEAVSEKDRKLVFRLIKQGRTSQEISYITELSVEEIEKLRTQV